MFSNITQPSKFITDLFMDSITFSLNLSHKLFVEKRETTGLKISLKNSKIDMAVDGSKQALWYGSDHVDGSGEAAKEGAFAAFYKTHSVF